MKINLMLVTTLKLLVLMACVTTVYTLQNMINQPQITILRWCFLCKPMTILTVFVLLQTPLEMNWFPQVLQVSIFAQLMKHKIKRIVIAIGIINPFSQIIKRSMRLATLNKSTKISPKMAILFTNSKKSTSD